MKKVKSCVWCTKAQTLEQMNEPTNTIKMSPSSSSSIKRPQNNSRSTSNQRSLLLSLHRSIQFVSIFLDRNCLVGSGSVSLIWFQNESTGALILSSRDNRLWFDLRTNRWRDVASWKRLIVGSKHHKSQKKCENGKSDGILFVMGWHWHIIQLNEIDSNDDFIRSKFSLQKWQINNNNETSVAHESNG